MKSEINKTSDLRLGYLKDMDNILSNIFQDGISENCFKNSINNDISKVIQYFGETNLLVGKISLNTINKNNEKNLKKSIDINKEKQIPTQVVPLYLSEKALKYLNKSFIC